MTAVVADEVALGVTEGTPLSEKTSKPPGRLSVLSASGRHGVRSFTMTFGNKRRATWLKTPTEPRRWCWAGQARPDAASSSVSPPGVSRHVSAHARSALRLGGPGDMGAGACRAQAAYISYFPDVAVPGASEAVRRSPTSLWGRAPGAWCCCRVGARRRPRRRAGAGRFRRRLDGRAVQLVQPELQRGLPAGPDPGRRARAPRRRRRRALHRRRRHRRGRDRGPHPGRTRRPALRADRPTAAQLCRRRGHHRRRNRPGHLLHAASPRSTSPPG